MADVQSATTESKPAELPSSDVGSGNLQSGAATNPNPSEKPGFARQAGDFISGFFKRNGRHPANCECPIHRKPGVESRFSPPVGFGQAQPAQPDTANPAHAGTVALVASQPIDAKRFEIWGRLARRVVKRVFGWLTEETPSKAIKVFGEKRGLEIVEGLELAEEELQDVEKDVTRLAIKYNLTTGYDEEISLAITLGSIFGRVISVNRKLDKALAELERTKPAA